jgi:hypothetical protein
VQAELRRLDDLEHEVAAIRESVFREDMEPNAMQTSTLALPESANG